MKPLLVLAFLMYTLPVNAVEVKKCGIAKWKWPHDFKLLSSKDALWEFYGYHCWIFRDKSLTQNGKYFCWKIKETLPPMTLRSLWDSDHYEKCIALSEYMDITYSTKALCMPPHLADTLNIEWHYLALRGFDKERCIRFDWTHLIGDVWMNNYMCGKPMYITKPYCEEEE